MDLDEKIQYAVEHTTVLRAPRCQLATFGLTNVYYHLVTELMDQASVVREGTVVAERPRIVTPVYLLNLEGFTASARHYLQQMARDNPGEAGIFYRYKNEPGKMDIVSERVDLVAEKLRAEMERQADPSRAVIRGVEELWDVSLIKFAYDLTLTSLHRNVSELAQQGLLGLDPTGLPVEARRYIEELFARAEREPQRAGELAAELKRWGVFQEYQDRFLNLFRHR